MGLSLSFSALDAAMLLSLVASCANDGGVDLFGLFLYSRDSMFPWRAATTNSLIFAIFIEINVHTYQHKYVCTYTYNFKYALLIFSAPLFSFHTSHPATSMRLFYALCASYNSFRFSASSLFDNETNKKNNTS